MLVDQLAYLKLRIIVDRPWTTAHRQTTVHCYLIEPQTFFSLVNGEKPDNQNY